MPTIKYSAANTAEQLLTTELNSLANNGVVVTATVSNDAAGERFLYCDVDFNIADMGGQRVAGALIEIYVLPNINGSFPYGGAGEMIPAPNLLVGNIQLDAAITGRRGVLVRVPLPPFDFRIVVVNKTGQPFAASGNTMHIRRYALESVA